MDYKHKETKKIIDNDNNISKIDNIIKLLNNWDDYIEFKGIKYRINEKNNK